MKNKAVEIIKELKENHQVSHERLADRFGVCGRTIENWTIGKSEPNKVELEKLQQILRGYQSRN